MMQLLGIREEALDDVVFEEENTLPAKATRSTVVARVLVKVNIPLFGSLKYEIRLGFGTRCEDTIARG
jgi:hypothetical protein